jgi:hypothetical protein
MFNLWVGGEAKGNMSKFGKTELYVESENVILFPERWAQIGLPLLREQINSILL